MKIRADEHVSRHLTRYIQENAISDGWEFTQVRDVGHGGATDSHWITLFASSGGHAIVTGDKDFQKTPEAVKAVFDTGMRVIHMPRKWCNARLDFQTAFLLLWWRRIESQIVAMKPRECYQPGWNLKDVGTLKRIHIDFAKAEKKLKKQQRRAENRTS